MNLLGHCQQGWIPVKLAPGEEMMILKDSLYISISTKQYRDGYTTNAYIKSYDILCSFWCHPETLRTLASEYERTTTINNRVS